MLHFSKWKISFIMLICLVGFFFALPNYKYIDASFKMPKWYPTDEVSLGLDLRGGAHLLLEVDVDSYINEQLENIVIDIKKTFREQRIGYSNFSIYEKIISFNLLNADDNIKAIDLIYKYSKDLKIDDDHKNISIRLSDQYLKSMQENVINQSIEIVNRRIDETGTKEPTIQRQGNNRILVQVPGLYEPDNLKRLLGKTAKLTFNEVEEILPPENSIKYIPPTSQKLPLLEKNYKSRSNNYIIIKKQPVISGEMLIDANASFDNNGSAAVAFKFNSVGARKFGDYTQKNIGKLFAIVLDGKVLSAPVIKDAIITGSGIISGNFTVKEANDLALLLRAGALPAPLTVVEERTVGPSLGQEAIDAGKTATSLGISLVIIFMILSYGRFGVYANLSLIMNVILIIATLSFLNATLTLPGIAGIALTVGMAVDANVLIFERIKEEIGKGSNVIVSIDQGFRSAFKAIFDANITTLIAAFLLYIFGSGPVRGFAVTLSVGIIISMFTAIMLTRLMISKWVLKNKPSKLRIKWLI